MVSSWLGSQEVTLGFVGFSLPTMHRPANNSGDLKQFRVLGKSGMKRGRTTHGERAAVQRGTQGAMTRRPICSIGASAIQVRISQAACAPATTCLPTA